jgi:hypothetical protein
LLSNEFRAALPQAIFIKKKNNVSASNQISWRWFQGDNRISLFLADYYSILFVCLFVNLSIAELFLANKQPIQMLRHCAKWLCCIA